MGSIATPNKGHVFTKHCFDERCALYKCRDFLSWLLAGSPVGSAHEGSRNGPLVNLEVGHRQWFGAHKLRSQMRASYYEHQRSTKKKATNYVKQSSTYFGWLRLGEAWFRRTLSNECQVLQTDSTNKNLRVIPLQRVNWTSISETIPLVLLVCSPILVIDQLTCVRLSDCR